MKYPPYFHTYSLYLASPLQLSVQFSHSVMSDSLRPHGLQDSRFSLPSPSPGVYSNSCPLSPVMLSNHLILYHLLLLLHSIPSFTSRLGSLLEHLVHGFFSQGRIENSTAAVACELMVCTGQPSKPSSLFCCSLNP